MALSADRPYRTMGHTRILPWKMTTNDIYYKGAVVVLTAAGGLGIVPTDTAGQGSVAGVIVKQLDNTGKTETAEVEQGVIFCPLATAAQASLGDYAYMTDDAVVALSATNSDPIGKIVAVEVGVGLWVDFCSGIVKTALA